MNSIALIVLLGLWLNSKTYFESALLIAMLGFISTVAVCKYILRGDIIECARLMRCVYAILS